MKHDSLRRLSNSLTRALFAAACFAGLSGCGAAASDDDVDGATSATEQAFQTGIDITGRTGLVSDYASDNQRVFFANEPRANCSGLGSTPLIRTSPYNSPRSTVPVVFGTGCDNVKKVVTDGTNVYYTRGSQIFRVSATGYDVNPSTPPPPSSLFISEAAEDLAFDSTHLYWRTPGNVLRRRAKSGGSATNVYVPAFGQSLRLLGSDGINVFFWENFFGFTSIRKIPVGGGTEVTVRQFGFDRYMTGFSMSSTHIFVSEGINGQPAQGAVWRSDKAGNNFAFITQQTTRQPMAVTIDTQGKVYWVNWDGAFPNGTSSIESRTNPTAASGTFKTEITTNGILFGNRPSKLSLPTFAWPRPGATTLRGVNAWQRPAADRDSIIWYVFD
jgi:hypothetical protein